MTEEMSFQVSLEDCSAVRIGMGSSFHQPKMVNEKILESDFVALCDGTTRLRSLTDFRLLKGRKILKIEWK